MNRGLFDTDTFAAIFGAHTEPPDSVPLRLLGLGRPPTSHAPIKAAFRARVMAAHPDILGHLDPELRQAAEDAAWDDPDVQELVWARDLLLRKTPAVTPNQSDSVSPRVGVTAEADDDPPPPPPRHSCATPVTTSTDRRDRQSCRCCGTYLYTHPQLISGLCYECRLTRRALALAAVLDGAEPPKRTAPWHDEHPGHGHCVACGSCLPRYRYADGLCDRCYQRALRTQRRAEHADLRRCTVCDGPLWPDKTAATRARSDRQTCSPRCRQKAHRQRKATA